jgi:hypothetical protein
MPSTDTDPFAAAAERALAATRPPSRCVVARLYAKIGPVDAASVAKHLARPTEEFPHVAAALAIEDEYKVSVAPLSLGRHRRGVCGCDK